MSLILIFYINYIIFFNLVKIKKNIKILNLIKSKKKGRYGYYYVKFNNLNIGKTHSYY